MRGGLGKRLTGYAFVSPWLLALCVFIGYPFLAALYFSFCDYPPLKEPVFIGADNYTALLADARFQRSMGVTLIYAAVAVPMGVALALGLAMFLNARVRGQSFYRVVYYIPHLVPTVVVAILWLWIFNPKFGLLNIVLGQVVKAVDACTNLVFDLDAARAGETFAGRAASLLCFPPVFLLIMFIRGVPAALAKRPMLKRLVAALTMVWTVVAAVLALNASLTYLAPQDMARVRAPSWLTDSNVLPSFMAWKGMDFAPSMALWAIIVMSMWSVGQMAVIYLAKLQDVPVELYEAADIDGAGWWHKMVNVTIPMISPVILFNVVMAIIGTFQIFAAPYIMTQGGPEDKTRFAAMFIYDHAFQYQRVGYASAVAWVLFLVIVALTVLAFKTLHKRVYYAGR